MTEDLLVRSTGGDHRSVDIEYVLQRRPVKSNDLDPLVDGVLHGVSGMRLLKTLTNSDEMASRDSTKLL